jgi:hypothetical protein
MQHITPASFAPETMADREDDMHSSQSHLVAAAMAAMMALLPSPVPAQTTSAPSATRNGWRRTAHKM